MKSLGIMGLEVADHEPSTLRSQGPSLHYRRGFATREGGEDCANIGRRTGFEPAVSTPLERARFAAKSQDGASRVFTRAATCVMSARAANWGLRAPMTLPIAACPSTPALAFGVAISRSISASARGCGMYSCSDGISACPSE